jgi:predicted enzyme related to lactoylglutathione lyase
LVKREIRGGADARREAEGNHIMAQPVVHFEIHGKDGKKLQDFYGKLFDWNVDSNNPMSYGMVAAGEGGIGGGITQSEAPMVTFYINVPDVGAALKKAESLGAKTVMPPMAVPGGPEIAQFSDPEGNVIGLSKM